MINEVYTKNIIQRLEIFSNNTIDLGRINLHDNNVFAESFFMEFLNVMFDWKLVNQNGLIFNEPGIDLYDATNHIVIQVSSTSTSSKIQNSLDKLDPEKYNGCRFKFMSIARDSDNLRKKDFTIPSGILFDPKIDIIDIPMICKELLNLDIDKLEKLNTITSKYHFDPDTTLKRMKGLSRIIQILSSDEYLKEGEDSYDFRDFEITDKIKKNNLEDLQDNIFDLYSQNDVNKVYETFDEEGINKSRAVLYSINKVYKKLKGEYHSKELFYEIGNQLYQSLQNDKLLQEFNEESIRYYIDVILADAFVRCKIFENPKNIK